MEVSVSELKGNIERVNESFALHSYNNNEERVKFGELYTAQYNEINKLKEENNKLRGIHSLTHSLTYLLTHLLTHLLTQDY